MGQPRAGPSKGKRQQCRDWDRGHSDISPGHFVFMVRNQSLTWQQCHLGTPSLCSSTVLQNIFPMFWKGIFNTAAHRSKFRKPKTCKNNFTPKLLIFHVPRLKKKKKLAVLVQETQLIGLVLIVYNNPAIQKERSI